MVYEDEFKKKLVHLHIREGRSIKSLAKEYNVSHGNISIWCKNFRDECKNNEQYQKDYDYKKEILKLNTKLADAQKENEFLKKQINFSTRDKRMIYMYIKEHKDKYGLNWLLKMCNVNKNAYYNFFKNKKEEANKKR